MTTIETIQARVGGRERIIIWRDERTGDAEFEARADEYARKAGALLVENEDGDLEAWVILRAE